jgi:menaquinone-dependent protoporphyrinogen IX oxidase
MGLRRRIVMRVVVVYESMFGNTRQIGQAIADGVGTLHEAVVVPVRDATGEMISGADLVVVGGPTHMHGMSRPASRKSAGEIARKPASGVALEPGAEGRGLREWFDHLGTIEGYAAAFDTRVYGLSILTGRASKRIHRLLRRHGARQVSPPESFFVMKNNALAPGEIDRARRWGENLVRLAAPSTGAGFRV